MAKKDNYDILKNQDASKHYRNRDIRGSQNVERERFVQNRTPKWYIPVSIILSVLISVLLYVLLSAISMGVGKLKSTGFGAGFGSGQGYQHNPIPTAIRWDQQIEPTPITTPAVEITEAPLEEQAEEQPQKHWLAPTLVRVIITVFVGGLSWLFLNEKLKRVWETQTAGEQTSIDYLDDARLQFPREIIENHDIFPDLAYHSSVSPSAILSHFAIDNKGIKHISIAERHTEDLRDENGILIARKGDYKRDDDGEIIMKTVPLFDKETGERAFEAAFVPKGSNENGEPFRMYYNAHKLSYNPGDKIYGKLRGFDTVADVIAREWHRPMYEVARPMGAYVVTTAPSNTMVIAITRAGKGQTYIEPMLDVWTRQDNPFNLVVNDPKGELLVKFYVPASMRGFEPVQFNLINPIRTDIYNPLHLACQAARQGDFMKMAAYVENIGGVFFPTDGSDEPLWPNAANNAFKRAAYGMIDYFLDQEADLRKRANAEGMAEKVLATKVDELWGHVSLYNAYQMFTQLASKKIGNPLAEFLRKYPPEVLMQLEMSQDIESKMLYEDLVAKRVRFEKQSEVLWNGKADVDGLTLYFNAVKQLPLNSMRTYVNAADDALRTMAGAEKMLASVYGIAITAMSFFADPTIKTLTSGRPSQNVDLSSFSFPRMVGVRFHGEFLKRYNIAGLQARWQIYKDENFSDSYGPKFYHEDTIGLDGWANFYWEGILPEDTGYMKLDIVDPAVGFVVRTFYFKFVKNYRVSLDGTKYRRDPITNEKLISGGVLEEMRQRKTKSGKIVYRPGRAVFERSKIMQPEQGGARESVNERAIIMTTVRYFEHPKMVFLVTPPHLTRYARIVLILLKQLVDLNFDKSYMAKPNQKPLSGTRFMLDELGNLNSEGHGITDFQTMLSIGLGQDQQFTCILQTLQQLRDVYGDSVDKIIQGNTENIIFLKSNDDSMIETLSKLSGTTHELHRNSVTITKDKERIIMPTEGKLSETITIEQRPVLSFNDFAYIPAGDSIVMRAGAFPIYNRDGNILPPSRETVFGKSNKLIHPGHDYTLQTIPTLSTALEFDPAQNVPDFNEMLRVRIDQATYAMQAKDAFSSAYGYTATDIARLDIDAYAAEIMEIIERLRIKAERGIEYDDDDEYYDDDDEFFEESENEDFVEAMGDERAKTAFYEGGEYLGGLLARKDIISMNNVPNHALDLVLLRVWREIGTYMLRDRAHFSDRGGELYSADGRTPYIVKNRTHNADARALQQGLSEGKVHDYTGEGAAADDLSSIGEWEVTDDMWLYLVSMDNWSTVVGGRFDREFARFYDE